MRTVDIDRLECYGYITYAININCALLSAVDKSNRQDSSCLYGTESLTNTCYQWISAVTEVVGDLRGEGEVEGGEGSGDREDVRKSLACWRN